MQQGGSQYGVPPPEMTTQFTASVAGPRSHLLLGGLVTSSDHMPMAEAVPPINSRPPQPPPPPPPPPPQSSSTPAANFEELTTTVLSGNFNEEDPLAAGDDTERGPSGNRWPREETLALIKIRSDMDATFRDSTLKGMLWDDVSRKLADQGYRRSAKKCKEKFENVHKYYKRTKEGRAGRQDGKNYRFFAQLEALHNISGGGNGAGSGTSNNLNHHHQTSSPTCFGSTSSTAVRYHPTPLSSVAPINTAAPAAPLSAPTLGAGVPASMHAAGGFSFSTNSSSSESDGEGTEEGQTDRKRKRRSSSSSGGGGGGVSKKTMSFFKVLMKQLMDQQATMQQRFLETIEKREQDRMIREEAWKRQEMSRVTREHEAMAQERAMSASRDAAIINFLQKYTGQKISVPPVSVSVPDVPPPPRPQAPVSDMVLVHDQLQGQEMGTGGASGDPASSRWPKAEVHVLIKLRSGLESRYRDAGPKGPLWEEISSGMKSMGHNRSAKRCKEKWENINKYFKKVKESNKKRPEDAKTCPYFHQLDALYRKKSSAIGGGNGSTTTANIAGDQANQDTVQETNPRSDVVRVSTLPPPPQLQEQLQAAGSNVENKNGNDDNARGNTNNGGTTTTTIPISNGDLPSTLFAENSGTGEDSTMKKPEHMMKEMIHAHVAMDDYDKDSDPNNINDEDEEDDEDEDEEEQKMAYKIEYQRPNVDNTSNGGTNPSTTSETGVAAAEAAGSFLAMVQ